jgi:hypothetical protein
MVGDSPAAAQRQARQTRRPLSRIVPAIPHRLSRTIPSARPITPDESNKGTVAQNELELQPAVEVKQVEEQLPPPPANAAETPMTPDSQASGQDNSQVESTVLAASPAQSGDDHVELTMHHQGPS